MSDTKKNGTKKDIGGKPCIYFDGYWIKRYEPPSETLPAKRRLIEALTTRLFNHVEHGLNIPGSRLEEARKAYEEEKDPARKRVNGGMLAGALSNRAADIFKKIVELQECGVEIREDNELMQQCGRYLMEALRYGKKVKHRNGDESIDELWGEPFKAFTMPVEAFYESRYIKIAQAMGDIDHVAAELELCFQDSSIFDGIVPWIRKFAEAAKQKLEILRTDPVIFEVWPTFVVAGENLSGFQPRLPPNPAETAIFEAYEGMRLILDGKQLLTDMARARVAMPKSRDIFLLRCKRFLRRREKSRSRLS